jgi:hypothetical protein
MGRSLLYDYRENPFGQGLLFDEKKQVVLSHIGLSPGIISTLKVSNASIVKF